MVAWRHRCIGSPWVQEAIGKSLTLRQRVDRPSCLTLRGGRASPLFVDGNIRHSAKHKNRLAAVMAGGRSATPDERQAATPLPHRLLPHRLVRPFSTRAAALMQLSCQAISQMAKFGKRGARVSGARPGGRVLPHWRTMASNRGPCLSARIAVARRTAPTDVAAANMPGPRRQRVSPALPACSDPPLTRL